MPTFTGTREASRDWEEAQHRWASPGLYPCSSPGVIVYTQQSPWSPPPAQSCQLPGRCPPYFQEWGQCTQTHRRSGGVAKPKCSEPWGDYRSMVPPAWSDMLMWVWGVGWALKRHPRRESREGAIERQTWCLFPSSAEGLGPSLPEEQGWKQRWKRPDSGET